MLDRFFPASKRLARTCAGMLSVSCLLALPMSLPVQAASSGSETATVAPKAATSLLLDVARLSNKRLIAVGERGHILLSDDEGAHWNQASVPGTSTLTSVYFVDNEQGWAVGHDATILATQDGGQTWIRQYFKPAAEKPLLDVWFANVRTGIAVGAYGLMLRTDDGGKTWTEQDTASLGDELIAEPHLNAIRAIGDGSLFLVGEAGLIAQSRDDGRKWVRLDSPYEGSFFGIGETPGKALLVAGLRGHLFRSVDSGQHWQELKTDVVGALNSVQSLASGVYVLGNDGVVLRSQDDGRNFSRVQRSDRKGIAAGVSGDDGLILVGEGGVAHTDISGQTLNVSVGGS